MGLESLPAIWHLGGVSSPRPTPRSFLPVDISSDGVRTLLTRRGTDAAECSQGGLPPRWYQVSPRASIDGGASGNGFSSRDPRSIEKGVTGPSSSFIRSDSSWSGQGFPESNGPSSRLLRWHSDGVGLKRMTTQFQNFPGDQWRSSGDDCCEVETYQGLDGFQRVPLEGSVAVDRLLETSIEDHRRAAWLSIESNSSDREGDSSNRVEDWSGGLASVSASASAVDVTAPSFVIDRKFAERNEHSHVVVSDRQEDAGFVDQVTDGSSFGRRPASVELEATRLYTGGDESKSSVQSRMEKVPIGLGERAACVSIPDSLRSLKKRNGRGGAAASSIKKAFDSMVEMIRALQSYTIQMRNILFGDIDVEHLLTLVHREMHASFLWLFQQVFLCTPTLMVSVMILLANFTVYSLGDNVAFAAGVQSDPPTHLSSTLQARVGSGPWRAFDGGNDFSFVRINGALKHAPPSSTPLDSAGGKFGNGGVGGRSIIVAGGEDGDHISQRSAARNTMFSEEDSNSADLLQQGTSGHGTFSSQSDHKASPFVSKVEDLERGIGGEEGRAASVRSSNQDHVRASHEFMSYKSLLEQTARELELRPGEPYHYVELDLETLRVLVAPVATKMESDNYPCFDRTDLEYQHAINIDPTNPMLLANYAQFLYAVRHDNNRAEGFFRRALRVDSKDGDILGRWASFLWLGLKKRPEAELAYRKAIALDPTNPYHAGSYAHFLWHGGEDESPSYLV